MGVAKKIKGLGMGIAGLGFVSALFVIPALLLFGATWISMKIFPWLMPAFFWTVLACVVVLAPATLFRRTREFAAMGLMTASFVFGFILWVWALLLTLDLWGMFAALIGLLFLGVGIVPVALLAALFHADWSSLSVLAIMIVATFGSRLLAIWLASKAERQADVYFE